MLDHFDDDDLAEDYRRLLRKGSVIRGLEPREHEPWRRGIRAKARADRLRIRTGSMRRAAWAALEDFALTDEELAEELRRVLGH